MRRYASAGISRRRVSICLSIPHTPVLYRNGCMDRADFLHTGFPQSMLYFTLCFREIRVPPKIRVLLSGTLSQTLNFRRRVQY